MGGRGLSGKLNTDCHFLLVCFIYLSLFILSHSSLVEKKGLPRLWKPVKTSHSMN